MTTPHSTVVRRAESQERAAGVKPLLLRATYATSCHNDFFRLPNPARAVVLTSGRTDTHLASRRYAVTCNFSIPFHGGAPFVY